MKKPIKLYNPFTKKKEYMTPQYVCICHCHTHEDCNAHSLFSCMDGSCVPSQETVEIIIDESAAEKLDLKAGTYLVKDTPSQETCTCYQTKHGKVHCGLHCPNGYKHEPSQEKEQDWEKGFDEEFGTYVTSDGEYGNDSQYAGAPVDFKAIKQFIHSRDKEVREQEHKRIILKVKVFFNTEKGTAGIPSLIKYLQDNKPEE